MVVYGYIVDAVSSVVALANSSSDGSAVSSWKVLSKVEKKVQFEEVVLFFSKANINFFRIFCSNGSFTPELRENGGGGNVVV